MTHKELDQLFNAAITALMGEKDFPCEDRKPEGDKTCILRAHLLRCYKGCTCGAGDGLIKRERDGLINGFVYSTPVGGERMATHKSNCRGDVATAFWYGSDAGETARRVLCPTCLAYWHVAVARNLMIDHGRFHRNAADEAAAAQKAGA